MEFRVLGPLQVIRNGAAVRLGGEKQRAILAALLLRAGSVVSVDRLVDEVWGEGAPRSVRNAIQVYVTQLRRLLTEQTPASSPIRTEAPGYVLDLTGHADDLSRFRQLTARARLAAADADHAVAIAHFTEALSLWRGAPLADVRLLGDCPGILAHLDDERLLTIEDRIDALLAAGRHAQAVCELEELTVVAPLRERLQQQLVTALYRCGRQGEALQAARRARAVLAEELGLDPGPALRALEGAVLRQDPVLDLIESAPPPTESGLPRPLTRLFGRDYQVRALVDRLGVAPMVTLTGPGGSGKTQLALAVAHALAGQGREGIRFVELAPLSDSAAVASAVALALGVEEQPGESLIALLASRLRRGRPVLVLDNCEHLGAACAALCAQLLSRCPGLVMLATSREPLGVPGEVTWPVEPLEAPDTAALPVAEQVWQYPSVQLFAERALEAVPTLRLTDEDAADVALICARLAGLPLAIELAAARVRSLSVSQIAARLDAQPGLLVGGPRSRLDRQQTLRRAVDWSYDLLSDREQRLFAWLSVFAGGFTLDAVETLVSRFGGSPAEALDLIDALVAKSLVVARHDRGRVRYRLLEPLRQYAAERLQQRSEADRVRELHAHHFLALAEQAEDALLGGPEQGAWFTRLEYERDNLNAAFGELCRQRDATRATRLAAALWRFWLVHGPLSEGRATLERALVLGPLPRQLHAKTLLRAGVFSHQLRDHARAAQLYLACTELVAPEGPSALLADVLANRGLLAENQGRLEEADRLLEHALRLRRDLHDHRGLPIALDNLGQLKLRSGDLAEARKLVEEACVAFRAIGDLHGLSVALDNLARIAEREGDLGDAATAYMEQLRLSVEIDDRWRLPYALDGLGRIAATRGEEQVAVRLFAGAAAARDRVGDPLTPDDELRQAEILVKLREQIGDAGFEQAWSRGIASSVADLAACFLAAPDAVSSPARR